MANEYYTKEFYEELRSGSTKSAEVIVPLILELFGVQSVVDVGCGDGSWLAVFRKCGVDQILGIDGGYVDRGLLQIPEECFQAADLTKPLKIEREFDLAVSLEVAEHLPSQSAADFVEGLTRLAPFVLFSAAIPSQGGTNHINEQWPDVWAELFRKHFYLPVDCVRKRVWQNDKVDWWYAQNMLLFVRADRVESSPALQREFENTNPAQLSLVHPRRYLAAVQPAPPPQWGIMAAAKLLLHCVGQAIAKRLPFLAREKKIAGDSKSPTSSVQGQ